MIPVVIVCISLSLFILEDVRGRGEVGVLLFWE